MATQTTVSDQALTSRGARSGTFRHRAAGLPPQVRDARLLELVWRYRDQRRSEDAAGILELVAPGLLGYVRGLRPPCPTIDPEDLFQQAMLEALEAALTLPLPDGSGYLERRVLSRVRTRMGRWLARERARFVRQLPENYD